MQGLHINFRLVAVELFHGYKRRFFSKNHGAAALYRFAAAGYTIRTHQILGTQCNNLQGGGSSLVNIVSRLSRLSGETTMSRPVTKGRYLVAFDFDNTITSQNTDIIACDLLTPGGIPSNLDSDQMGWNNYMIEIFRLLNVNSPKITAKMIIDAITGIPEVPGMTHFIKRLKEQFNCDLIIVSDSNTVFICEWLAAHGLNDCFVRTFSNPAHFDDNELLVLGPYQHQTECRLSAVNMCKANIMEHFLIEQDLRHDLRYEKVIFVGDGINDLCPVLRMRPGDFACGRDNYAMDRALKKHQDTLKLHCDLIRWSNGFDLMTKLFDKLAEVSPTKLQSE